MTPSSKSLNAIASVREILNLESKAILSLAQRLDESISKSIDWILGVDGRVIFIGLGKTGCIARKAAATFCSTGTPAIFLHAGEASHGDLGIVTPEDIVVALSYSGESVELLNLMPYMQRFEIPVVCITGNPSSQLAQLSNVVIDVRVETEADDNQLAPTCSTTVALAICDALAITIARTRGFTEEQFAIFHPGGNLGRKLLVTVKSLMHIGVQMPVARSTTKLREAIVIMSQKRLGALIVVGHDAELDGILTDGDIRRVLQKKDNPLEESVGEYMTKSPRYTEPGALAAEALQTMQKQEISVLPVVDVGNRVVGIIHIHDLLKAGLA